MTRKYSSPAREAQASATRERILAATVAVIGEGIAALSIPAVARQAEVSVPTVYRYFPDKEALLDAAATHVRDKLGVSPDAPSPVDVDDYLSTHRTIFRQFDRADAETIGAVIATFDRGPGALSLEQRRQWLAPAFAGQFHDWPESDRRNLLSIASILSSSVGATALAQFELRGDEAADLLAWTIGRLLARDESLAASAPQALDEKSEPT
ncbi:MAG: TetR/AcrR family transcriptional regulator [Acidimicrobiales bacterium]